MDRERREILYAGRVQGVGFRATARNLARARGLDGHVRNLPDGRVELVVEGKPATIELFLADLRNHFGPRIVSADETATAPTREPGSGFDIRY